MPTYTFEGKNILGLGAFKSYAGLWFFQGALLQDKHQQLINAQKDKTQAMRQWRITSMEHVNEAWIKQYIQEAIQHQKEGQRDKGAPQSAPDYSQRATRSPGC